MDVLERARQDLGLTVPQLWIRYFELGGMRNQLELEAILNEALVATAHDRDVIAAALNERFSEIGSDHPVPYSDDTT